MTADRDGVRQGGEWRPGKLWSLLDMINFALADYMEATIEIAQLHEATKRAQVVNWLLNEQDRGRACTEMRKVADLCQRMGLVRSLSRVNRLLEMLDAGKVSAAKVHIETVYLHEAMNDDIKEQHFFQYKKVNADLLIAFDKDWTPALAAFPSVREDALSGVDCYTLGHPTASVFLMMRVLEKGLRAMSAAVNRPFEQQQWQNILDQIESGIKVVQDEKKTPDKADRLAFLSQAAKEFRYFKDGWRNYAAHAHAAYDTPQALSVMNHVRDFMNHLATRLHE